MLIKSSKLTFRWFHNRNPIGNSMLTFAAAGSETECQWFRNDLILNVNGFWMVWYWMWMIPDGTTLWIIILDTGKWINCKCTDAWSRVCITLKQGTQGDPIRDPSLKKLALAKLRWIKSRSGNQILVVKLMQTKFSRKLKKKKKRIITFKYLRPVTPLWILVYLISIFLYAQDTLRRNI